jgi:Calcineurin-like phosphoesterase
MDLNVLFFKGTETYTMQRLSYFFSLFPLVFLAFWLKQPASHGAALSKADGPYIIYRKDTVFIHTIYDLGEDAGLRTDTLYSPAKKDIQLKVPTGNPGEFFTVTLKTKLQQEKAEYRKVPRQLAISDIDLKGFLKLLMGNGVIDKQLNWTFGDGHLVLTGDFFDRGVQVTELLWFIYSLEDKAKAAGGYVHFVLGNHEIMNMNGDFRYVQPRYMENAALMKLGYLSLFDEQTELGRWLRTKNIVEKIGEVLYMHGGISSEVNLFNATAPVINELARPYYGDTSYLYPNVHVEILYSEVGPFWYRGYYTGSPKATEAQIDSTLNIFGAKYIATGHTIARDTISTWFNNKLFNTDVPHGKGFSEGLLIEKGKFYRVNESGERFLIAG